MMLVNLNLKSFLISLPFCIILVQGLTQHGLRKKDLIRYYSCTYSPAQLDLSSPSVDNQPDFRTALSIKINGTWESYTPSVDQSSKISSLKALMTMSESCRPTEDDIYFISIIKQFGDLLQSTEEIAFYTQKNNFDGVRLTTDPTGFNTTLTRAMETLSWFFKGVNYWSVYLNIDFTANSTCPDELSERDKDIRHSIRYHWNSSLDNEPMPRCMDRTNTSYTNTANSTMAFSSYLIMLKFIIFYSLSNILTSSLF